MSNPESYNDRIQAIIQQTNSVIPVLTIHNVDDGIAIANALVKGGLPVLEVTLRTENALDIIAAMKDVEGAIVGAGTVTSTELFEAAKNKGADFIVSPGSSPELLRHAKHSAIPLLPGIATASEIMMGLSEGFQFFKFFPAATSGGSAALKAFAGPFPDVQFCPTGGINQENRNEYLTQKNVSCVGGSWLTPKDFVANKQWSKIQALAESVSKP